MKKPILNEEKKRNILARLQAISENETELESQRTEAILALMNTESILQELREEKNEIIKKLVKIA